VCIEDSGPVSHATPGLLGFMAFVANLQKQYLRQQFALFCWVHMTLLVIVVSRYVSVTQVAYKIHNWLNTHPEPAISHFIVNNILEGLIWFFVPASLVICNDVMAYVCGELDSMKLLAIAQCPY
jgi:phosphatidate cytidylyltransferase